MLSRKTDATRQTRRADAATLAGRRPGSMVMWLLIALALAALAGTYMLLVEAPPPRTIVIATGSEAGAYHKLAEKYAAELAKQGLTLKILKTNGSVENLELLRKHDSGVVAAIIQSGVATTDDQDHLVALGSLYREPLWVFYRGDNPLFEEKPPPKNVVIATGGNAGAYYKFGQKYAEHLKKEGINVEVRATNGSAENLTLLGDDAAGVDVAIVQSGVASKQDREKLLALGSLYREPLWVFYRGDKTIDRLESLAGKRIGVGKKGSGTYPVAMDMLAVNGLAGPKATAKITPIEATATDAVEQLRKGELDAAFFVAAIETPYIMDLLKDKSVRLMSFSQHEAYQRTFRFLSDVTLPAGLVDLGNNLPEKNVNLLAPTAMLVVRKNTHTDLIKLLLSTAAQVHAKGDQLSNPGEFPSPSFVDLPLSEEAKQFYRGGSVTTQRLPPLDRISLLEGKRINVGPLGSGTNPVAMQLLKVNRMLGEGTIPAKVKIEEKSVKDAADDLLSEKGTLDAAFFVAAPDAEYIQKLMNAPKIRLMNFSQHEAYQRKFRYLSEVKIPAGLVDFGRNIPRQDINLVAPTAMLVVRKDMHPALVSLLLTTATRIHGKGGELSTPGEFPSASFTDLPVSEDAKHFYKSGPPVLQRLLPFWLASLADRLKIMLIPLVMLLMPLFRAAPPLVRWRTRRKIYRWYADLRDVDKKIAGRLTAPQLAGEIARVREIEHQVSLVEVPLSYMEEFYNLRLHVQMMHEKLAALQRDAAPG